MSNNNTTANCTVGTFEYLAYSPVFFVGFFVNGAALRAFISTRASWTDTHIYMLNLTVADFILILSLPFRIYDTIFCMPITFFCTFLMNFHFTNMYVSILTTTAISVHRYLVIKFPLQARSWRRKKEAVAAVCLMIWTLMVTMGVIFRKENYPENLSTCFERCESLPLSLAVVLLQEFVGFILPLLTVVFCSSQIVYILLRKHQKSEERRSIIGIVTANMIVFFVCYAPIHVAFLVNHVYKLSSARKDAFLPVHTFLQVSEWIASTNCCFDSISYYFLLKKLYT